jgi:hypothetical protein
MGHTLRLYRSVPKTDLIDASLAAAETAESGPLQQLAREPSRIPDRVRRFGVGQRRGVDEEA